MTLTLKQGFVDDDIVLLSELEGNRKYADALFHKDLHIGTLLFNRVPMRYFKLTEVWDKSFVATSVTSIFRSEPVISQLFDPGAGISTVIDVAKVSGKWYVVYVLSRLGPSYSVHGFHDPFEKRYRMENPEWNPQKE